MLETRITMPARAMEAKNLDNLLLDSLAPADVITVPVIEYPNLPSMV